MIPANQYDGSRGQDSKGHEFLEWTKNYLIGQAPDIQMLLKWAQNHDPLPDDLKEFEKLVTEEAMTMADVGAPDPMVLSGHLWSYLNSALVSKAKTIFSNVPERHGLEAWRRIYKWMHSGSAVQRRAIKRTLDNLPQMKRLEDVATQIEEWERTIRRYTAAGGRRQDDEEMKLQLTEMLPEELAKSLSWRVDEFKTFEELRDHVLERTEQILFVQGRNPRIYAAEAEDQAAGIQNTPPGASGVPTGRQGQETAASTTDNDDNKGIAWCVPDALH